MDTVIQAGTVISMLSLSFLAIALGRMLWRRDARAVVRNDGSVKSVGHPISMSAALSDAARKGERKVDLSNMDNAEDIPDDERVDLGYGFSASFSPEFAKED